MKGKRDRAIHKEPFDLYFYFNQSFKVPERYGGVITTDHLVLQKGKTPTGELTMTLKVGKDAQSEEVEPLIGWHSIEDDPKDVMNHCYEGRG